MSWLQRVLPPSQGKKESEADEEHHWLSVSDLMAGLMMVFLFIAVVFMRNAWVEKERVTEVAVAYQENQVALYQALMVEFEDDLDQWEAAIDETTLSFTFQSPDVLFATGSTELQQRFRNILADFFPRYLDVLMQFSSSINEVRIEGHTSSVWGVNTSEDEAYFNNMELSQGRTRTVLNHVYGLDQVSQLQPWVKANVAAVGFSSSRLELTENGIEDREASRRVSFRVITNADTQIRKILEQGG
ncbi:OmpA family protein [Vreelandella glaciei]|uniref:OmpA/MotB family protein n=1 Tax=Vreelandella glaciei TaxID=186761 RepID=UPI0030EEB882|tara:strand:- start:1669 stop:2400 length:732 start_codon:yes stop_codon:yes gene_type:complete